MMEIRSRLCRSLKPPSQLKLVVSCHDRLKENKTSILALFPFYRPVFFTRLFIGVSTLLFTALSAHALSARTAKAIEGTEPYLLLSDGVTKLTNLNELLGFSMPKRDGTSGIEQIDVSMAGTVLTTPSGMKYQDVIPLITADGHSYNIPNLTVGDADGDASPPANISTTGQIKATWYDGNKQVTNLNRMLSDCGGPYTLKIEIPMAVSANTTFGAPSTKAYGTHAGVTYTFAPSSPGICYLQPRSMDIFTSADGAVKYANGYNSAVWEYDSSTSTHKGFKVDSGFPTTGFNQAVFRIIGSGNDQSKYRCRSADDGGKITLSGAASLDLGEKCTVTYNVGTKPEFIVGGAAPTINMEYNISDTTWVLIDSYTIPVPDKWALPQATQYRYGNKASLLSSTSFPALDQCRVVVSGSATPATTWQQAAGQTPDDRTYRQTYMYRRDELTNSPNANTAEDSAPAYSVNYYSRDVDGTFMGEWGKISVYSGSGWDTLIWLWTIEAQSTRYQFFVTTSGAVSSSQTDSINGAVCRG